MLSDKPVAVKIKPVMIESSTGPRFVMFCIIWISRSYETLARVDPAAESLHTIRVVTRVKKNYRVIQITFDLGTLGSRKMICGQKSGVHSAGLISMNTEPDIKNSRHILYVKRT